MQKDQKQVQVGVGVYIRREGKILLGKRKGSHGEGFWCPPGGHLDFGESWEDCARREAKEECGLEVKNVKFGFVTDDIFEKEDKHYVTIAMVADYTEGEARLLEPEKCQKWEWFGMDELPEKLFLPNQNAFDLGFNPFRV